MEFANDFMAALQGRVSATGEGAGTTGFDWSGLHARLVAAHAARAELMRGDSRAVLLDGGFTDWSATGHSRGNRERVVNPADSTDGKGPQAITAASVGQDATGGRG
jgi:hypothetical protein